MGVASMSPKAPSGWLGVSQGSGSVSLPGLKNLAWLSLCIYHSMNMGCSHVQRVEVPSAKIACTEDGGANQRPNRPAG
jgi:hypothetical protein